VDSCFSKGVQPETAGHHAFRGILDTWTPFFTICQEKSINIDKYKKNIIWARRGLLKKVSSNTGEIVVCIIDIA
jgi:hypothetical protein